MLNQRLNMAQQKSLIALNREIIGTKIKFLKNYKLKFGDDLKNIGLKMNLSKQKIISTSKLNKT